MMRSVYFSPALLTVALFPALLQGSPDCNPPTGNATLVSLELEAGGLNRVVGFDPVAREYNVWFDVPSTVTLRAQATDPGSTLKENSSGNFTVFGVGSGEVVLDIPADLSEFWVTVVAPGGAAFSHVLYINPACSPGDCNDADSCTSDACNTGTSTCEFTTLPDGVSCDGGNGNCQSGTCVDNCDGVDCSDGTPCTLDVCDSLSGGTCSNPPGPAGPLCDAGGGPDTGQCDGLGGCPPIDPTCLAPVNGSAPTACRSSFDQRVSTELVDMTIMADRCVYAGQPFNATVTPTMTINQEWVQRVIDVLCATNITTDVLIFDTTQVRVDALAGATCTSALSELSPVPQDIPLDITFGSGGTCAGATVNSPASVPLPPVAISCIAGAAPGPVAFCADGTTPSEAFAGAPAVDTWAEIQIGFPVAVSFQCGDGMASSSTIACTGDPDCAGIVGNDGSVSTCNLNPNGDFCTTVPLDLDPATQCITLPVAP